MQAFEDKNHEGNSKKYHTGKQCIEKGCNKPAGTAWSPYWCFDCNVERMRRIESQLTVLSLRMRSKENEEYRLHR